MIDDMVIVKSKLYICHYLITIDDITSIRPNYFWKFGGKKNNEQTAANDKHFHVIG